MARTTFIEYLKLKKLAPKTIKDYNFYFEKMEIMGYEFNQDMVDKLLIRWNNFSCRAFIKNYISYLKRKNVNVSNIEIPKLSGREQIKKPKIMDKEEVIMIADNMPNERYKLMVLLNYYGALRSGELVRVKPLDFEWKDFGGQPCKLTIPITKGGKFRVIPIPSELAIRIRKYITNNPMGKDDTIFKIKVGAYRKQLRKLGKRLEMILFPHLFRHSFASYLVENKWRIEEVQEFLGHKDISTTRIYIQLNPELLIGKYSTLMRTERF